MESCRYSDIGRAPKPRDADQARLATDAVTKLEGHKSNRLAQTKAPSLGRQAKQKKNQSEQMESGAP